MEFYIIVLLVYLGVDLLAAWGLNLEFGVAGITNFAYIVFVAAGAYTYAILTLGPSTGNGGFQTYIIGASLPGSIAILAAMMVAGALGVLVGLTSLRKLRADYHGMVMLVASILATTVVIGTPKFLGGAAGLSLIRSPISSTYNWSYVLFVALICVAAYLVLRRFTTGPLGRSLRAMREDDDASMASGKNTTAMRLAIQGVGGAFAGLSGALLAGFIGGYSPSSWQWGETLVLITAIVVGGAGNDTGVLVGAAIVPVLILQGVTFLPQVANHPILTEDLAWMAVSSLTLLFLFLRPQGLLPERRPRPPAAAGHNRASSSEPAARHLTPAPPLPAAPSELSAGRPQRRLEGYSRSGEVLQVRGVSRAFGGVHAVDHVDLTIAPGSITGLIGPNGAGKSTLLGILSGFVAQSSGSIQFGASDISKTRTYQRARLGVVRTFQLPREFSRLNTLENLVVAAPSQRGEAPLAVLLGTRYWSSQERALVGRAMTLLEMFGLEDKAGEPAGTLSGGQKRIIELLRALMARPKLLLLDEPMAGLSPLFAERLESVCGELRDQGSSVLVIEHELPAIDRMCDHVIVMAQGKVLAQGDMKSLRINQEVQDAYLVG